MQTLTKGEQPNKISPVEPTYAPLVETCAAHGISRTKAFEFANQGLLDTFLLGRRKYVYLQSVRTLPQRMAERQAVPE
jgi:hypothetical protein